MKNLRSIRHITLILIAVALAACGSDSKTVPFDLSVAEIQQDDLNENQKKLLNQIEGEKGFDPVLLDQLLIEAHVKDYNSRKASSLTRKELEAYLLSLKEKISLIPEASASERKVAYEALIESQAGKPILYNRDAVSVADLWQNNRLQCYSGSVFYHLMAQRLRGDVTEYYTKENPVFVYTAGHIEPGRIVDGVLETIETTASGKARVIYGKASELRGCIQVVKAEYFALMEVLKVDSKIPSSLVREAIEKTAEAYSIDLKKFKCDDVNFEGFMSSIAGSEGFAGGFAVSLAGSPFNLPSDRAIPEGDQKREEFDVIDRSDLYTKDVEAFEMNTEAFWEAFLTSLEEKADQDRQACGGINDGQVIDFLQCLGKYWPSSQELSIENFAIIYRIYLYREINQDEWYVNNPLTRDDVLSSLEENFDKYLSNDWQVLQEYYFEYRGIEQPI